MILNITKVIDSDTFICNGTVVQQFIDGNFYVFPSEDNYVYSFSDEYFEEDCFKEAIYFEDLFKLLQYVGGLCDGINNIKK